MLLPWFSKTESLSLPPSLLPPYLSYLMGIQDESVVFLGLSYIHSSRRETFYCKHVSSFLVPKALTLNITRGHTTPFEKYSPFFFLFKMQHRLFYLGKSKWAKLNILLSGWMDCKWILNRLKKKRTNFPCFLISSTWWEIEIREFSWKTPHRKCQIGQKSRCQH